jgi:quercetin dioxygenase-like cupin family protein
MTGLAMRYHYDFDALDHVPEGVLSAQVTPRRLLSGATATTGKSLSIGAVVAGSTLQVSLVHNARGTGSKLHTHPNEQFNYVLAGTLLADIDGQVLRVTPGQIIHIPAGMVHSHVSTPEADVIFVAAKDTRHGIVGPPVDGQHNGPRTLPGFGEHRNNEWEIGADGLPQAQSMCTSSESVAYVYGGESPETVTAPQSSGRVVPRRHAAGMLARPAHAIEGEKLRFGLVRVADSAAAVPLRAETERFYMVLAGTLHATIDGQDFSAAPHTGVHIPAGVAHRVRGSGPDGALCVLVESITSQPTVSIHSADPGNGE